MEVQTTRTYSGRYFDLLKNKKYTIMENLNLPPFFIGQQVVCIKQIDFKGVIKGNKYTVQAIKKCCGEYSIVVVRTEQPTVCYKCYQPMGDCFLNSIFFRAVEENFQSISLEKILEEETKLIGVN